jgi:hypothetical protein
MSWFRKAPPRPHARCIALAEPVMDLDLDFPRLFPRELLPDITRRRMATYSRPLGGRTESRFSHDSETH